MAKRQIKSLHIVLLVAIIAILVLVMKTGIFVEGTELKGVQDKGVTMKVYAADALGNPLFHLSPIAPQTFALVVRGDQTYTTLQYIVIESVISNIGQTEITLTGAQGSNPCAVGNTHADCSTTPNNYGGTTTGDVDGDGDIDGLYAARFGAGKVLGEPGNTRGLPTSDGSMFSEAINVSELEVGDLEFTLAVSGNFVTERGVVQPLSGVIGSVILRISSEQCSDATPVDTCSETYYGKRCEVVNGYATLVNRATTCGCCYGNLGPAPCGWEQETAHGGADTDVCTNLICDGSASNQCIPGEMYFCTLAGIEEPRCNQCSYTNCVANYYGDVASGCDPSTGDPSVCDYPDRTTNTLVNLAW